MVGDAPRRCGIGVRHLGREHLFAVHLVCLAWLLGSAGLVTGVCVHACGQVLRSPALASLFVVVRGEDGLVRVVCWARGADGGCSCWRGLVFLLHHGFHAGSTMYSRTAARWPRPANINAQVYSGCISATPIQRAVDIPTTIRGAYITTPLKISFQGRCPNKKNL